MCSLWAELDYSGASQSEVPRPAASAFSLFKVPNIITHSTFVGRIERRGVSKRLRCFTTRTPPQTRNDQE